MPTELYQEQEALKKQLVLDDENTISLFYLLIQNNPLFF